MASRRFVIVGDGAAGMTAAQRLRHLDPAAQITVLSDDPHPAYYRAALTNYLLGELRDEQVWAVTPSFFAAHNIERLHAQVQGLDLSRRELVLPTAHRIPYDSLLIATGARARPAPFNGAQTPGRLLLHYEPLMSTRVASSSYATRSSPGWSSTTPRSPATVRSVAAAVSSVHRNQVVRVVSRQELGAARDRVRSAVRLFLVRLFQARFISDTEARREADVIGASLEPEDLELDR